MSEPAASFRPLSGAEEFDRRVRSLAPAQPMPTDALAELARLVGHNDPFRDAPATEQAVTPHERLAAAYPAPALPLAAPADQDPFHGYQDAGEEPGAPVEPAVVHAPEPQLWERAVPRYPSISVREDRPIEPSPDAWAQGVDFADQESGAPVIAHAAEPVAAPASSPKRTLVVLAAVVILTGGGLAASFLARPSTAAMVSAASTATPTIMASTGPTKVQPVAAATGADAPSEPSTLLDKNKNDGTNMAKIVNSVEQPVDLAQAIKATPVDPAEPTPATQNASGFPEPRRVKTVLVRPDGSVIPDAPAGSAAPAPMEPQEANLTFDTKTALPMTTIAPQQADVPPPVVQPPSSTGAADWAKPSAKTTARASAAKPATSTSQDGSAAAQARTTVATPKAKPVPKVAKVVKPKAVVVAAATPADGADAAPVTEAAPAATGGSGIYAIQLGATPSEAEGKATAARLGQKFAGDLGGAKPSIHKATAAGKTVYRIRVGNLSQDAAKALCAKVTAGGGGCFVARN